MISFIVEYIDPARGTIWLFNSIHQSKKHADWTEKLVRDMTGFQVRIRIETQ